MGALVSLSVGEAVNILQQWHSINRDETWSKRGYDMSLQSMRIDILNTVREEMRDQVTVIISSLDNLMVVATLMLSIGFGFVVEGTFPPAEEDYNYNDFEQYLLLIYAILAALSLVFPLACLMLTIAARFEVELCQQDVMGDLQKHLLKALHKEAEEEENENIWRRASSSLEGLLRRRPPGDLSRTPSARGVSPWSRAGEPGTRTRRAAPSPSSGVDTPLRGSAARRGRSCPTVGEQQPSSPGIKNRVQNSLRRLTLIYNDSVGQIAEDEVRLVAEGLLQKVNHYHKLYPIAQLFLWLGMHSSVLTCSVMLGLYFKVNYPSTPWMWRCYSGILSVCAVVSVSFLIWMKLHILREPSVTKSQWQSNSETYFSGRIGADRRPASPVRRQASQESVRFGGHRSGRGRVLSSDSVGSAASGEGPRAPLLPLRPHRGAAARAGAGSLSPIRTTSAEGTDAELHFESAVEEPELHSRWKAPPLPRPRHAA